MKNIKMGWWLVLLVPAGLWFMADTLWVQPFRYFPFREVFIQFTGVVAMAVMSVGMVLATRPRWLEARLNGLDKMYRLHKWLGITALVVSVVHWWMSKGTKWMVGWGWLERPARRGPRGGGEGAAQAVVTLEQWLNTQRHLAESMGEWAFYGAVVLMVLALVKWFPYRLFAKTHRLLAVAYLVLAFHTVVLLKYAYWSQPVGWLMAVLTAAGVVAALMVLLGRVGAGRKVSGEILEVHRLPALRVVRTTLRLASGWPGHEAGQFAFVTTHRAEGAHPYTIASQWDPATREITFITKALGDYTATLPQALQPGMPATVEGPYGCFTFNDDAPRQIWVGGGIGITPFVARLKEMAQERARGAHAPEVDLFHTTTELDPEALALLEADAAAAGVHLHVLVDARDGRLTGERLRAAVPDWRTASVWFCGPAGFGTALRTDLLAQGLPAGRFHQELFAMR
ncbi:MAG: ferric reductase-like transmembrane domain-containing protein [Brachymonas sp.]